MTSRERVRCALGHRRPDRVPLDLGATSATGIQASAYRDLKRALGIQGGTIRVSDTFQMLADVEEPVRRRLGVDTLGVGLPYSVFGYRNEGRQPFRLFDGTEVEVSGNMAWDVLDGGDIVQYPCGDRTAPPSARMPKGGYYFDFITRQNPYREEDLDPRRWAEETFSLFKDEDLRELEETVKTLHESTEYALVGNTSIANFGSVSSIQSPHVREPSGIRDIEEFWISYMARPDYVKEILSHQLEIGMRNLERFAQAVGDRVEAVFLSGADFGSQGGPLISPRMYRDFFKPLHARVNRWVHENTRWKTFYHTCGSVEALIEDFIEAEIDVLNPVQVSAKDMAPELLAERYGGRIVFWGGGVDTQRTLPFGTADEVRREAAANTEVFERAGGFVFAAVHNIQANVPPENLMALFDAVRADIDTDGDKDGLEA